MNDPDDWETRSVGELCERVTSGGTPSRARPEFYANGTIPWIKTGELRDGYIESSEENITAEAVRKSSAKLLPRDTVLMAMYGATVGALGMLDVVATCNQASCAMVVDPTEANPRWLFYALFNDRERIIHMATGAAQQNLSGKVIRGFEYPTPPVPEQQAIAEVLGALDDKIAANTRLAATADELLRQTFASLPKSENIPLSSSAQFINGKAFTKGASGSGRLVVRIAELNSGPSGSTVYSNATVEDKHVARVGDILFAWSGSLTLHRWFRDDAIVNQHIFKVIPANCRDNWLVYELLRDKLADFKAIAADKATTMGHIQRHHLDEEVPVPSQESVERVRSLMQSLWDTSLNAERESLTLAATRDALLPKLMSGQLRVRDAEKIAEQAGV